MVAPRRTGLRRVYLFGLVAVAIGLVVGLVLWNTALTSLIRPSSGYQPPIKMEGGALPPLDLIDQYGKPFSLEMVKGEPVFVFFGYTNCPDVCPVVLQKFAKTIRAAGK